MNIDDYSQDHDDDNDDDDSQDHDIDNENNEIVENSATNEITNSVIENAYIELHTKLDNLPIEIFDYTENIFGVLHLLTFQTPIFSA